MVLGCNGFGCTADLPHNAMTPHVSGTTLSAQARYTAGSGASPGSGQADN
jgi:hypothetical protein